VVSRYQKRLSGPLLDRIDTPGDVEVPRVDFDKLSDCEASRRPAGPERTAAAGSRPGPSASASRLRAGGSASASRPTARITS
jgi:hypothetical protein